MAVTLPSDLAKYVQDYKINVFDIAFLEDEVIEKFTSDFKAVARFFKDKRLRLKANNTIEIKHPEEIADLFSVFTGDKGYRNAVPEIIKKKEVESGDISPERACEKLGITLNELEKKMKDANFQFPRHYK